MDTFEKIKKSWWVLFPFTLIFSGFGFIYVGYKSSNKNWIFEGIAYEMPWLFYFISCALYSAEIMVGYYIWIILLAAAIALIRSIIVAVKLLDVYDMNNTVRVNATVHSSPGSTDTVVNTENKKKDSNMPACCACLIFIFIIFAIISIL